MELDTEDKVSSRKFAPLKNSKPILQHDLDAKAIVQCSNCTMSCVLAPSEVWIPSQCTPKVIAPESERTKSHLHIITCDNCSYGTCIACGLAPHLSECIFADTRASLQALCSVDEAVTLLHKNYPGVATLHDARDVQHVLLESLTKIMATISGRATPTFGLAELLRKSTHLDIISELIRNTTVQSIELSPLLIQTWEFLYMIAERKELCVLLSEKRVEMKEKSWGLGELTFPLAFLPINQDFGMDLVNTPPREYSMWPLLQHCVDVAKQYLLENKDDIWSAAIIAKRIIDVHDMMKGRVPRVLLSPKKVRSTQLLTEYAAGLHELYTAGITRKTQVNKSLNLGNTLTGRASAGSRQARAGFKREELIINSVEGGYRKGFEGAEGRSG